MAIEQKSSGRSIVPRLITLVVLLAIAGIGASVLYPQFQAARGPAVMSQADALDQLKEKLTKIDVREEIVTQVAPVEATASDLAPSLPPIETFPIVSNPQAGANSTVVEIFTSTEKSGSGTDGWMTQTAEAFNAEQHRLNDGTIAQVAIRKIASGTAYEFIGYQAYRPDAFSPSNELWIRMAEARGVKMVKVRDRTVGNVAGIVMKEELAERLEKSYGKIDLGNVVEEVVQGRVVAGYTDPFASSTGLNFLVSVLAHFGKGSGQEMLAPEVVSAFEQFQKGVPFVALTTIQMRDSVVNDGSLDTFVMEWQTFAQAKALQSGYRFVPFGQRHDNPLYAVGDLPPAKMEALEAFAEYAEAPKAKQLAEQIRLRPGPQLRFALPAARRQDPAGGAEGVEEQEGRRPPGRRRVPGRRQRLDAGRPHRPAAARAARRRQVHLGGEFHRPGGVQLGRAGQAADPPVQAAAEIRVPDRGRPAFGERRHGDV